MPAQPHATLLPAGLTDLLPPEAQAEAAVVERMMAECAGHGYERVKPPLVEFEDNLLAGSGAATAGQTFRLMDPVSQGMMGVRADITLQIARIASSRLIKAPRPLRLAYAGDVLRVKGTQLRPERQVTQVGAELIGSLEPTADAEVVLLAARCLEAVGVERLSVDLNVPTLVPAVCQALGLPEDQAADLRAALDRKDAAAVAAVGGRAAELLGRLMAASGPAVRAVAALAALDLPAEAEPDRKRLTEVVRLVGEAAPDLMLTVDPVEHRGFEYQTGISFTLFGRGVRGELGRGGRYRVGGNGSGEPATGFSLYLDTVLRAVPEPASPKRLFVPHGTPAAEAALKRAEGWVTVAGLAPIAGTSMTGTSMTDVAAEARRLGCGFVLRAGVPETI